MMEKSCKILKVSMFLSLTVFCIAACGSPNSDPVNLTEESMEKARETEIDSTEIVEKAEKDSDVYPIEESYPL